MPHCSKDLCQFAQAILANSETPFFMLVIPKKKLFLELIHIRGAIKGRFQTRKDVWKGV